jgi:hypothetical protein
MLILVILGLSGLGVALVPVIIYTEYTRLNQHLFITLMGIVFTLVGIALLVYRRGLTNGGAS